MPPPTLSLCCNTQAKIHVGTIPVRAHQVERVTNLDSHKVGDPGTASPLRPSAGPLWAAPHAHLIPASVDKWPGNFGVQCYDLVE